MFEDLAEPKKQKERAFFPSMVMNKLKRLCFQKVCWKVVLKKEWLFIANVKKKENNCHRSCFACCSKDSLQLEQSLKQLTKM